jgi:glycosyltransferase involved in cell wall biosynthesis
MSSATRKIIFVHGTLGLGGAEVLRQSVLEELSRDASLSLRVCVLREEGVLASQIRKLGVPVDFLNNRGGLLDVGGVRRLAGYLRSHDPDVVQSSQFVTNLHTVLAGKMAGVPRIAIEEHGIYTWKRWYHRLLDRWVCSRADYVVACSESVAKSAAKHLAVSPERINVVHNCVASSFLSADQRLSPELRHELAGGKSSLLACMVGTLRWEKGHRFLIEAWKRLVESKRLPEDTVLLIVGDGPLATTLRQQADGLRSVRFLGSRDDVGAILRSSDLFLLPSVNEGFGIAIIEAMAAGVPVISTSSGGIPEIIDHERNGLLVEPGDVDGLVEAIACMASSETLRQRLSRKAQDDVARRFTPAVYCDALRDLWFGEQP